MRFKIFILISIFFSLFLFCPAQAKYGLEETQKATGGAAGGGLPTSVGGAKSLPALAGKIVNVALSLIGILFFCLMLYAGITWMKAFGNSEDVTKAKDMITQAIIGLVIVMMAYAISNFVFTNLGASGGGGGGGGGSSENSGESYGATKKLVGDAAIGAACAVNDDCGTMAKNMSCVKGKCEDFCVGMGTDSEGQCMPTKDCKLPKKPEPGFCSSVKKDVQCCLLP